MTFPFHWIGLLIVTLLSSWNLMIAEQINATPEQWKTTTGQWKTTTEYAELDSLRTLGDRALESGRHEEAVKHYRQAIDIIETEYEELGLYSSEFRNPQRISSPLEYLTKVAPFSLNPFRLIMLRVLFCLFKASQTRTSEEAVRMHRTSYLALEGRFRNGILNSQVQRLTTLEQSTSRKCTGY